MVNWGFENPELNYSLATNLCCPLTVPQGRVIPSSKLLQISSSHKTSQSQVERCEVQSQSSIEIDGTSARFIEIIRTTLQHKSTNILNVGLLLPGLASDGF